MSHSSSSSDLVATDISAIETALVAAGLPVGLASPLATGVKRIAELAKGFFTAGTDATGRA